ncbi:MAG: hypothetical protein KF889_19675 [Alphaproteobacteria bacterium]|nr:hypothetical protein [Alphaproteobacteria bacterium]MCW5744333.1 hypothetical protein [Alphaproteobacteria bacterium]
MGKFIGILFGPLVWFAHLAVLYGSHASVCAMTGRAGVPPGTLVAGLGLATALALLLASLPLAFPTRFAAMFLIAPSAQERRFMLSLMRWLAGLSVFAVIANGLAVLLVPPC